MIRRQAVMVILWLLFCHNARAAEGIAVIGTVDKNVVVQGEEIKFKLLIIGAGSQPAPSLPKMEDFTIYPQFHTTKYEFVEGRTVPCTEFDYLLVPSGLGKKVIPPVKIIYKGYFYETKPIAINVVETRKKKEEMLVAPRRASRSAKRPTKIGPPFFLDMSPSKREVYINEQIVLTISVYNRVSLKNSPIYTPPQATGFWKEDLGEENRDYTDVDGMAYLATNMIISLFPTALGEFRIDPAKLEVKKENFSDEDLAREKYLKDLFSSGEPQAVESNTVDIKVIPLPEEGRPASFSGVVGEYSISAQIDRFELVLGEPIVLEVIVSGRGNLKGIPEIELPLGEDFRKHDTETSLDTVSKGGIIQGSKTFRSVIIALEEGERQIPPIEFSYFDPGKKRYERVHTESFTVNVLPPPEGAKVPYATGVKMVSKDIHHIKMDIDIGGLPPGPLYSRPWYYSMHALPVLGLMVISFLRKRREKLLRDPLQRKRKLANQNAQKLLKQARYILKNKPTEHEAFFALLQKALNDYLVDRLDLSHSGLTFNQLREELIKCELSAEEIELAKETWEKIALARFTTVKRVSWSDLQNLLNKLSSVIRSIEKSFSRRKKR